MLEAENLSKGFGDKLPIDDLSFKLPPGGIVGVIGPNGAGKTTLFKMLTGAETPDDGALRVGDTAVMGYVTKAATASMTAKMSGRRFPAAWIF